MSCPSTEDVTRELIRRLQVYFSDCQVFGASGVTALEVVESDGRPVIEAQDRPQITVIGPTLRPVTRVGAQLGERVLVSTDQNSLTGVDAPAPLLRHLDYQLVCTALRESTSASGQRGIQWLEQAVTLFGWTGGDAGPYLLGDGWTGDEAPGRFRGYLFELSSEPQPIPTAVADMRGFSAAITIKDVRITDGSNGDVPITRVVNLNQGTLP